jgi:hypothetical protein
MKVRVRLALVVWAVTFGLVTWWVVSEGGETVGPAATVGAVVASLLAFAAFRLRK